jgi:NAD/NADP transhydrogenase alpha subunit
MIVGSIKENTTLEKRVSITPETAKNIIGLGLKVNVRKRLCTHLGIQDKEYKNFGVEIKNSSTSI